MTCIGLWSSRVCFAKSGLRPSLQLRPCKSRIQTGDERVGVAALRGCMLELVQVPISPWERRSELPHIYNNRLQHQTTHTHKPTNIGTVSQHLQAERFFFLFLSFFRFFVMGTFRRIACTQTHSRKKMAALHLLSPTAFLPLSRLNAEELLCNSSCFPRSVNTLSEEVCTTFSSTPSILAGSDSPGPAATVTNSLRSI